MTRQAVYTTGAPWADFGEKVGDAQTAEAAIAAAGLDWEVDISSVYAGPTQKKAKRVPGKFAVYRTDTEDVLGVVSKRYRPFQNSEAFTFMDSLVQDAVLTYEQGGLVHGGRQVWLLARLSEGMEINGEEFVGYLLLTTGHDGLRAVRVLPTLTRVFCTNQLSSLSNGDVRVRVVHSASMELRLQQARDVLKVTTESQRRLAEWLEQAQEIEVENNDIIAVQTELLGPLDDSTPGQRRKAIETFQAIYAAEMAINGNTAYSLVNAITGFADHGRRYKGSSEERAERRFESVMEPWGGAHRFKDEGLKLVGKLVKAGS